MHSYPDSPPAQLCKPEPPSGTAVLPRATHLHSQEILAWLDDASDVKLRWQPAVLTVTQLPPIQPAEKGGIDALKHQKYSAASRRTKVHVLAAAGSPCPHEALVCCSLFAPAEMCQDSSLRQPVYAPTTSSRLRWMQVLGVQGNARCSAERLKAWQCALSF